MVTPARLAGLSLADPKVVVPAGALHPTVALDPASGTLYLAFARETRGPNPGEPVLQAVVARSTDQGRTFSEPVVVNDPSERVDTSVVSPIHVAAGPQGEVYVLYQHNVDSEYDEFGLSYLRVARSEDRGVTFSPPAAIAGPDVEGVTTTMSMGAALALDRFLAWSARLRHSWLPVAERVSGALVLAIGLLLLTGVFSRLASWLA